MRKKIYQSLVCLLLIGNAGFAQQWNGGSNSTDDIYRTGKVTIGANSGGPAKLTVTVGQQNDGIWIGGTAARNIALLNNSTSGAWNSLTQPGDHLLLWKEDNIDQNNSGLVLAPWSSSATGLRITPGGSVGIGTAFPGSFKLAVEGKIGAREVQVTLSNPFPDYVFASNYKLRSLTSLESYINQNKHLPGIPSAAEVEKKGGIELGQLNTKLLEKVEELTLYIIEINKKVEKLEKENQALKGK